MILDKKYTIDRPRSFSDKIDGGEKLKLHKNENMDFSYTSFLYKKIMDKLTSACFSEYPDLSLLYSSVANYDLVLREQLIFSFGADGIIRNIYEAFHKPGAIALYPSPTFAMYQVYASTFDYKSVSISYSKKGGAFHLEVSEIIDEIRSKKPRLFFLANPDSPTGTILYKDEIKCILDAALKVSTVVAIDEAYYPFHNETCVSLVEDYPNLIVIRTFSKAWGLAGARVGYAISNEKIIDRLQKIKPMYELGHVSVACALTAIQHSTEMMDSVNRLNAGKTFFEESMKGLGFECPKTYGNFSHVVFGALRARIHETLSPKVLYRESFNFPILKHYARFSSTTKDQFERVVDIIKQATK